jgi:hypothetical protein
MPSNYFGVRFEQESIDAGLAAQQEETGTTLFWWFFNPHASRVDPVYDEGSMASGLRWQGPYPIAAYSATRTEGAKQMTDEGFYTVDTITVWLSYRQAANHGLLPEADRTNQHLKDRFVWDGKVWSPENIVSRNLLSGGGTRAMIVVTAVEVKPEEMVNDVDFLRYSSGAHKVEPDPTYLTS